MLRSKEEILAALKTYCSATLTAKHLGLSRSALYSHLKEWGIDAGKTIYDAKRERVAAAILAGCRNRREIIRVSGVSQVSASKILAEIGFEKKFEGQNLIGQTFGSWTVLGLTRRKKGHGEIIYLDCVCSCGQRSAIRMATIVNGQSQRCKSCAYKSRPYNVPIRGQKTGRQFYSIKSAAQALGVTAGQLSYAIAKGQKIDGETWVRKLGGKPRVVCCIASTSGVFTKSNNEEH